MKDLSFAILFFFANHLSFAQSLLVNGNFEDENICTEYQINCSPKGWISTSDAFNNFYKIPGIAHSGEHCMTIAAGNSKKQYGRTYIRTQLLCQLHKGNRYKIEFYIKSRHDMLDSTGVYFTAYDFLFEKKVLHSITPGAYITDAAIHPRRGDTSWQKVSFEYLATGEEVYLTLGNFSKRDITGSTNIPLQNSFLVFFDDISLTPVDVNEQLCNNWLATKEEIYSFAARHQFLDIYVKRHSNNSPETPKIARTIIRTIDTLVLPDILFETDRSELNKKSFYVLDSLCDLLKNMQVDSMVVEGSTDNSGTATHNKKLSSDRALSVTRYVIEKSLLNSRLVVSRGLGSEKPIGNNETPEGRQLNRRVEIFIYIGKSF